MTNHTKTPLMDFLLKDSTYFYKVARRYGLRQDETEDAHQELALKVLEFGEKRYNRKALPKTYLSRMYRNLCIDFRRKKENRTHFNLIEKPELSSNPTPIEILIQEAATLNKPTPLETLTHEEDKIIIIRALSQLPPRYQRALRLYSRRLSYKEIAAKTRTTVSIIKNTIPAAKTRLKKALSKYYTQ